jgi:hypothetical protein
VPGIQQKAAPRAANSPFAVWLKFSDLLGVALLVPWAVCAFHLGEFFLGGRPSTWQVFQRLPSMLFFSGYPLLFWTCSQLAHRIQRSSFGERVFRILFYVLILPTVAPLFSLTDYFWDSEYSPSGGTLVSPFKGFALCYLIFCVGVCAALCFVPVLLRHFPRRHARVWAFLLSFFPLIWLAGVLYVWWNWQGLA